MLSTVFSVIDRRSWGLRADNTTGQCLFCTLVARKSETNTIHLLVFFSEIESFIVQTLSHDGSPEMLINLFAFPALELSMILRTVLYLMTLCAIHCIFCDRPAKLGTAS